jgi:hypothetical protein
MNEYFEFGLCVGIVMTTLGIAGIAILINLIFSRGRK